MSEHVKQNASGLYIDIQKIGCFFRSACLLAEYATGKSLTVMQLNSLWDAAKRCRFIDSKNNVKDSAGIANLALRILKNKTGKFYEVATFQNGLMKWYRSVPEDKRRADYHIQKIVQSGPSVYHFRYIDKYGDLIEDPHDPEIKVLGVVYTICYRYDEGAKK